MSNAHARRSSIRNPQVQEELKNLVPHELFRGSFAEYNLTNITRLSGNTQRGSLPKRSGIPTPLNKFGVQNPSASRDASIMASRSRNQTMAKAVYSGSRSQRSTSIPRNTANISAKNNNFANPINIVRTKSISALNSTRRKSKSHESLSGLQTPAITPAGRSRSRSPGVFSVSHTSRRGVHNEIGDATKINVTKDKKILAEMARSVWEFLESQDCQARPSDWKEFMTCTKLSDTKYKAMIKFLASHFVGDAYFNTKWDDTERIIDVLKLLKYPGTLSKSHLKTPTVQHAWPGCFTLLVWLCARTQALLFPPSERSNINELVNNGLQEFAFESYLNLFPLHFRNEGPPDYIDKELENFRCRVREAHASEISKTKEELIKEKLEREAELEHLKNEVDPCEEVKNRLLTEKNVKASLDDKINELEKNCKKYSDCNHLNLQRERIQMEIKAKTTELQRIKQQVDCQPLSKQEALAMENETASLKNQLDTISHVNKNLKEKSESRRQKLAACQKEFFELCKKFDIVEKFNENLRLLRLEDYTIPNNPFEPKQLEEWMKEIAKTLRACEGRVNEMLKDVKESSEGKARQNQERLKEMNKLHDELKELNKKLESVQKYKEFLVKDYEEKIAELQHQLDEKNAELLSAKAKLETAQVEKQETTGILEAWKKSLEEYQTGLEDTKKELDKAMGEHSLYEAMMREFLQRMACEAAESQQQFYLTHFNIDIFSRFNFNNDA